MSWIRMMWMRLATLWRGHTHADADLHEEMQAHLEMEIEENIRRGMKPAAARRKAMLSAGGFVQAQESVREQRGLPWLESIAADTRFAFRHFRRTPLSTITMVLVLSLGLGTSVVMFTVLNSITMMPAPGLERDASLVRVRGIVAVPGSSDVDTRLLSWPEVEQYATRTELFASVAAHADETGIVSMGDAALPPLTVSVIYATSNYFDVLDVRPFLGNLPVSDGLRLTTAPTAMISHAMWQQHFGGDRAVIGRTVRINDIPVQISAVAPPRFVGTTRSREQTVWVPLNAYPTLHKRSAAAFGSYDSVFLSAAARLRPGVTKKAAGAVVAGIGERSFAAGANSTAPSDAAVPDAQRAVGSADVVPMLTSNHRIADRTDALISSVGAGAFALLVLLITCTNVSALVVGLAVARRKEIGVRLSLGAPRRRLIRQLLTESVIMALVAATVALLGTAVGLRLITSQMQDLQLVVDWRVTLATCAVAVLTGILFGLSPALHATRVSVGEVLKSSAAAVGNSRSRLQRALVVAQIALTQPLLVGLGVVILTLATDAASGPTSRVNDQIAEIELDVWAQLTMEERGAHVARAVERVAAMPGVMVAMPMQMGTIAMSLTVHPADRIAGRSYAEVIDARATATPPGYLAAFEIPVVGGRSFDDEDYALASHDGAVAPAYDRIMIGSDLARTLWGDANPIGRRLTLARSPQPDSSVMVVIGVVDGEAAGPSEVNGRIRIFVPYSAMNKGVIARTAGPAAPLLNSMRKAVSEVVPQLPVHGTRTMAQREAALRSDLRRASSIVAGGGLIALLLSAIGLYAVVAFAVGQRTHEIGIRTALGAQRGQVVRMFFGQGLLLSAIGLAVGLPLSLIVVRVVVTSLSWPLINSPTVGLAIGAGVLIVASIAVWIPARRASTIDPLLALRSE